MRTIQEYLKECNREEVINHYIYKYTFDYRMMDDKYKDITVGQIIERQKDALNGLINRLIETEPTEDPDGETWILVSVHSSGDDGDEIRNILVKKSEVMDESLDFVTPYGYEFSPFEEVVGFYVADTYLTQYYLTDLITEYLFEVSFTGYEQEYLREILDDLKKSSEEIENGTAETIPFDDVIKQWEEEGIHFEKKDKKQEEAWKKFIRQGGEYASICQKIEMDKLRALLA